MASLPPLPANLKAVQNYIKIAAEHDIENRDPVVSYYCKLYAFETAMKIDKTSPEARQYLGALMDHLEQVKKESKDEAIHNELMGQAHMEYYSLKVFLYADNEDRASRFSKNVVKSFYTAGLLFDVLTNFGDLAHDIENKIKYAKWKAVYIHRSLKNGETPLPGPFAIGGVPGEDTGAIGVDNSMQPGTSGYNPAGPSVAPGSSNPDEISSALGVGVDNSMQPGTSGYNPAGPSVAPGSSNPDESSSALAGLQLTPADFQQAFKYCKYASSAIQYEDTQTAIENLQKALTVLTTGSD